MRFRIQKLKGLAVDKVNDVAHRPFESFLQHLYGGIAAVGKQNRVVESAERMLEGQWLFVVNVETDPAQLPALEGAHQRGLGDDGSPRGIDQKRALFHQADLFLSN